MKPTTQALALARVRDDAAVAHAHTLVATTFCAYLAAKRAYLAADRAYLDALVDDATAAED